jgi:Uma2 family endonuclease
MPQTLLEDEIIMGPESAGLFMESEEFDNIKEFDENYRYELIHGVVVVSPIPLPEETSPNDLLGYFLLDYQRNHPEGKTLDSTLPQQYVRTNTGRRIADRLIWVGLGRAPNLRTDVASIAVEFVSGGKRDRQRDYVDKRCEYMEAGVKEYWIVDRFKRTLTVISKGPDGEQEKVIKDGETYESALLPGYCLLLAELLGAADHIAQE